MLIPLQEHLVLLELHFAPHRMRYLLHQLQHGGVIIQRHQSNDRHGSTFIKIHAPCYARRLPSEKSAVLAKQQGRPVSNEDVRTVVGIAEQFQMDLAQD